MKCTETVNFRSWLLKFTHTLRSRQPCWGTDGHPAADRGKRSLEDMTRSCLLELCAAAALAVSPARQHTVHSVAGGGMCSLTAPFHLDKDFQGHVRFPAGSSPAPVKSQARSPGPWCAFPPSASPGRQHNLLHSSVAVNPSLPTCSQPAPWSLQHLSRKSKQAQHYSSSCFASRPSSSCAAGSG